MHSRSHESSHASYSSDEVWRKSSLPNFFERLYGGSANNRSNDFSGSFFRTSNASPQMILSGISNPAAFAEMISFLKDAISRSESSMVRFRGARILFFRVAEGIAKTLTYVAASSRNECTPNRRVRPFGMA